MHTIEQRVGTLRASLQQCPGDISTREALARLYQEHGMFKEAYEQFAHLRSLVPVDAWYCINLGLVAQSMGHIDQAMQWNRCAIVHDPHNPIPHNNLANCLRMEKQTEAAEQHYRIAMHLDPDFAIAHCNYGNLLRDTSRSAAAVEAYKSTLDADPFHGDAWCNLGILDMEQGNIPSAIVAYRTVLTHNPRHAVAVANLVHCLTSVCDWDARDALLTLLIVLHREDTARRGHSQLVQPYHALGYPVLLEETVRIARAFAGTVQHNANHLLYTHSHYRTLHVSLARWQASAERLRIAYISSDFGNHPLSQLMQHAFGMHDRSRLEVYGYALSADDGTVARGRIERGMDRFFDVHRLTVLQIMDLIRCHRVHVLIDLNGYTRGAQPEILALRAAAVQIHYMGFCGTLGAPFVDYLITTSTRQM
jgi:protein O-GlcNAc transferase